MSNTVALDSMPLWVLFVSAFAVIVVAGECGYRFGRFRALGSNRESDSTVGGMVAAELALLAFLLAFTFGNAGSRFDARRQVLLNETNAIGTAYLRAAMLPEPHGVTLRGQLREYVDSRLAAARGESLEQQVRRSEELLGQMWTEVVTAAGKDTRSIPIGLCVSALNDVIDLHTERLTVAVRTRIPMVVWLVLGCVAVLSFLVMGYHSGLTKTSRSPAGLVVAVTFAVVITLIADLDRPGRGLLRVSQQPMIELRASMEAPEP